MNLNIYLVFIITIKIYLEINNNNNKLSFLIPKKGTITKYKTICNNGLMQRTQQKSTGSFFNEVMKAF